MNEVFTNKIICGNCVDILKKLPDQSIDLCCTSPPYKEKDGFSYALMQLVFEELYRVQKSNTLFFLNFGHLAVDKMRPFKVAQLACDMGYQLNDTIVWFKNHFSPIHGSKRLNNLTEFIFLLFKGKMPNIDRLSIGVPYIDPSNAKRFNKGRNLRCRGNIWEIPYQTINSKAEKSHPDRFPILLPEFCIRLSGISKGSLVIDPFCGSGTSCVASVNYGMKYLGIDISSHWVEISQNRLQAIGNRQMDLFT